MAVGTVSTALAKLVWPRDLKAVSIGVLGRWAVGASALPLMARLWLFHRDGRLESYALMVLGCAAGLWWAGFGRRR